MRSFQKNGRFKHIIQSKTSLIFLGIVIIVFIYSMFGFIGKMEETIKNRKIIEDKIAELEQSKEKFNTDINNLKTDKGVEESIRDKFGLAKEGENLIMITDDKNSPDTQKDTKNSGFFSFITNLFK